MHNHDDKYPARPRFEPETPRSGTSRLQAPVDTNEPSGPVQNYNDAPTLTRAGTDFRPQMLTAMDVRIQRPKSIPELKGLIVMYSYELYTVVVNINEKVKYL